MTLKLGLILIGQSPRPALIETLRGLLTREVDIVERGVLDDLSADELRVLTSRPNKGCPLVTAASDGTPIQVDKDDVTKRLPTCINRLESEGCRVLIPACTWLDDVAADRAIVLAPYALLHSLVPAILPRGRLGIIVADQNQIRLARGVWEHTRLELEIAATSPFGEGLARFDDAARTLRDRNVDLIVLDCFGYTPEVQAYVAQLASKPAILPLSLTARLVNELSVGL
jgi:protein AroM